MPELSPVEPTDADELAATRMLVREVIFPKLSLTYGQRLGLMYEGLNPEAVEVDWATELDGVRMEAIRYALKHLPAGDFPPNNRQFRAICNQCPVEGPPPEPKQKRLTHDGSIVPEGVRKFTAQVQGQQEEGEEPVKIRTARTYIARVTAEGHRITVNEKAWLKHYQRIVESYDANQAARDKTAEGKAAAQAAVDARMQQEAGGATHG